MLACTHCAASGRPIPLAPLPDGSVLCRCRECGETQRIGLGTFRLDQVLSMKRPSWTAVVGES